MQERTLHNARGIPLRVINAGISSCPPLESLHAGMQAESALLSTTVESLQSSYDAGLGIALTTEAGEAVGFLRFSQLLGAEQKEKLRLPEDFPDVLEVGSAFIHPDYRGGIYGAFKNEVLQLVAERIEAEKVLVLGTTKWWPVIIATLHARELGINFSQMSHTDLDMLAPFTCTCNPNFGSGFHRGSECFQRVTQEEVQNLPAIADERRGKVPCTMSVSSLSLGQKMNEILREHFQKINPSDPQRALINALVALGHYN